MITRLLLAVVLAASSYSVAAVEPSAIAGFNFSNSMSGKAEAELDRANTTIEEDIDSGSFSAFVGYQTSRNNRFKVAFETRSFDLEKSDVEEDASGFRFDWDFVYGEQKVHPFWAIGFGFYSLEDAVILNGTNLEGDDLSGVSVQFGGGVKIDLTDAAEVSIAFERQAIAWQEIEIDGYNETINLVYSHNSINAGLLVRF